MVDEIQVTPIDTVEAVFPDALRKIVMSHWTFQDLRFLKDIIGPQTFSPFGFQIQKHE
jgi:hypothetical protein